MGRQIKRPVAGRTTNGLDEELAKARLDLLDKPHAAALQGILTPRDAVAIMQAAGAIFTVQPRTDGLGMSFTYRMSEGGDLDKARAILAAVKAKPPAFLSGVKIELQRLARSTG